MAFEGVLRLLGMAVTEAIYEPRQISIDEARETFEGCRLSMENQGFPHFPRSDRIASDYEHHTYFERLNVEPFDNNGGHLVGTYVYQARCARREGGVWRPGRPEKKEFRIPYSVK